MGLNEGVYSEVGRWSEFRVVALSSSSLVEQKVSVLHSVYKYNTGTVFES